MSESLNICLSCGFCCNGTTIGFVMLDSEELSEIRALMDIEEEDEKGFILQPCNSFGCNGCNIYAQRPKHCDEYRCEILKSVENKELDFDAATKVINAVGQKKVAIEKHLATLDFELKSRSFYFKVLELKKLLCKDELSLSQSHKELMSDIEEMDKLLSKYFGISFN